MSEPTFEIVFRGKLLREFERSTVVQNLVQLFKVDAARIEAMLDQPKLVLKRGLGKEAAQRFQDALRQAGMMVAAVQEGGSVEAAAPTPAPTTAAPVMPVVAAPRVAAPVAAPVATAPATSATAGGSLSLAPAGTPVLESVARPQARSYDLSGLSLDAPGTVLAVKAPPPPRRFDSSLELEAAPPDLGAESAPSALDRALNG